MNERVLREQLCEVGRTLHAAGLIAGTAGNLSCRLSDDHVLVTPAGRRKDQLDPSDLVVMELGGHEPGGMIPTFPTSEWPMHRGCYLTGLARVGAVVHAHAPALTAAGLRGIDPSRHLPELTKAVGGFASVPFLPSGSEALGEAVAEAVAEGASVILLHRHGVTTVGCTPAEAFDRMELAELAARAVLWATLSEPGTGPRSRSP